MVRSVPSAVLHRPLSPACASAGGCESPYRAGRRSNARSGWREDSRWAEITSESGDAAAANVERPWLCGFCRCRPPHRSGQSTGLDRPGRRRSTSPETAPSSSETRDSNALGPYADPRLRPDSGAHELLVGDAAKIRAMVVRRQKTDARDASHLLDLLMTDRFPKIWVPTPMENDLRQLLWHRQKLVWMRTSVKNQLHALAMSQGVCRKAKLWTEKGRTELEQLALDPWASRRRTELLHLLDHLTASVNELNQAVEEAGQHREDVRFLMTHPGVGRIVALAFALIIGTVERFPSSKQLVSYLGLNPSEHSSGGRQRLGAISKQGNRLMRSLLVEAAQTTTRVDPHLRRHYRRLKARRTSAIAKVAIARKLAVRLFWMLRSQAD